MKSNIDGAPASEGPGSSVAWQEGDMPEAKAGRTRFEHANPILNVADLTRFGSDPKDEA
jgi:hypothetical protein